jgi:sugar lactone lactonase YvrE
MFAHSFTLIAQTSRITQFEKSGALAWTNATVPGIVTVESAPPGNTNWSSLQNAYSNSSTGNVSVSVDGSNRLFRLRSVNVSPTAQGFTNWMRAYGVLETIAGSGLYRFDDVNYWLPEFENGPATGAALSRPHWALADKAGNIYIADKNSHAILRVSTNGTIHTHAGTHEGGFNGEGPTAATNLQLKFPNALWVRGDGTVYVLDTDNARVRRVDTNGVMQTLFNAKNDPSTALGGGRCLWVRDDEQLAYFGNTDRLRKWTPAGGLVTHASGFTELGCFYVETNGNMIVADRGAHYVYRVFTNSTRVVIAGNGTTGGGGDGSPALSTGIYGPRGVWAVPTGGYLLLLHDGAQLWFVDAAGTMRLLITGVGGSLYVHAGDGQHFFNHDEYRIGEGRSVAMDDSGNIILCESDYGFIRRVRFQRMTGY